MQKFGLKNFAEETKPVFSKNYESLSTATKEFFLKYYKNNQENKLSKRKRQTKKYFKMAD